MSSLPCFAQPLAAVGGARLRAVSVAVGASLLGLAGASTQAQGQAEPLSRDVVVVTASRFPERVGALAAEVSVIDRAMLDRSSSRTLAEVLSQLPGLQFSSNGGLGKTASLFFRGLESRHTLLLVDGVRMGSATVGTPSLDNLPLDAIERIEVVRGPMSALYGSDAVGGVVQIFTSRGQPGLQPSLRASYGSHQQNKLGVGLGYGAGAFDAALQLQHTETRGISVTNERALFGSFNPDRDGFRQLGGSLRLGWQWAEGWRLDALALESNGRTALDDGLGADAQAGLRNSLQRLQAAGRINALWQTQLSVARSTDAYNTLSSASEFASLGTIATEQTQLSWENRVATPLGSLLLLAERLQQKVQKPEAAFTVSERSINALAMGLNGSAGSHLWQAALRSDHNSQFGVQNTGALAYAYRFTPAWRAGLSYGSSFVAPSFNQLYFPDFGNPDLQPERGRQAEAHLRWSEGAHSLRATVYQHRIRGYISSGPLPGNIPRTRIQGLTLAWEGQWRDLKAALSLDHVDPRNATEGHANFDKLLPRRARNAAKAQADWTLGDFSVGGTLAAWSHRYDNPDNSLRLSGFATLDLRADWAVAPAWTLGLQLNNVADRAHETAWGYNQPGREGFVTLRWLPR